MYDTILTDFKKLDGDRSDSERIQRDIDATENGFNIHADTRIIGCDVRVWFHCRYRSALCRNVDWDQNSVNGFGKNPFELELFQYKSPCFPDNSIAINKTRR